MAHELEMVGGVASMFSVKETPWHRLGRIVHEAPNAAAAIQLAGLDWKVGKRKVQIEGVPQDQADQFRAVVRESDGTLFNVLSDRYTPLQNSEAFDFFNPFVDKGLASFETAGSLRGGRNVWVLAKLNRAPLEIGKGDAINKFLLLSNGHDGTMAVRVGFTPIRVVCANTLAMSHNTKQSHLLRVMHSKAVVQNLERVQDIVNAADAQFEATAEQYRALSRRDVNQEDLKKYVKVVYDVQDERDKLRAESITKDITRLFETGYGQDLKGARGTFWGLYNAVSQQLSYERGKSEDSRLHSLWFSEASRINQRAFEKAVEMVAA